VDTDCAAFLDRLGSIATVLSIKLFRLDLDRHPRVPVLPCLDHEAILHEGISPHIAMYAQDARGQLHEIVYTPSARRIDLDIASTLSDCPEDARARFLDELTVRFPECRVQRTKLSWIRGDRRVAAACAAQVKLRDVLSGPDLERTTMAVSRLQMISSLMEKESRVASWGARTVMTPLLAVAGFVTYQLLGSIGERVGASVEVVRYAVVSGVGGFFLYYGLKAVHLTKMANRVWKRSAEYGLILAERRRLERERMT
jgi:hypothetical protein